MEERPSSVQDVLPAFLQVEISKEFQSHWDWKMIGKLRETGKMSLSTTVYTVVPPSKKTIQIPDRLKRDNSEGVFSVEGFSVGWISDKKRRGTPVTVGVGTRRYSLTVHENDVVYFCLDQDKLVAAREASISSRRLTRCGVLLQKKEEVRELTMHVLAEASIGVNFFISVSK